MVQWGEAEDKEFGELLTAVWIVTGIIGVLILYFLFIFPTQWVRVDRVRAPVGIGRRIVQVSDIHVEKLNVPLQRLRRLIADERPDLIVLTGDFTQKRRHLRKVERFLDMLKTIPVPIYAVLGNHDYRLGPDLGALLALFRDRGIPVLRNEAVRLSGFTLVGIDDPRHPDPDGYRPRKAFAGVRRSEKTVVLAHDPNVALDIDRPFGYMMSGHFHGGQFRLPFVFRLKNKGPLPRRGIVKGLHRLPRGLLYISQGIGQANLNARFLIRSEFTVHEL